jgi:hypothetical protein
MPALLAMNSIHGLGPIPEKQPMNYKLSLVLIGALTTGVSSSFAQAAAPATAAPSYSITATGAAVSQYMFRGQRLGGLSFQPAVEVAAGSAAVGVWANVPLRDKVADVSDPEFDLYGSYTFGISDALSIVPGFTYYFYPNAPEALGFYRSTFEPNVALNYTVKGVKLTPKIYYDTTLEGTTYEFTAGYTVPLKDIDSELGLAATYGSYYLRDSTKDASPAIKSTGDYWSVGATLPFKITEKSKLTIGGAYTEGKQAYFKQGTAPKTPNTFAVGRAVWSVAYAYTF